MSLKNIYIAIVICFICITFVSCGWIDTKFKSSRDNAEVEAVVNSWLGKVITVDPTVGFITTRGDSADIELPDEEYKLIRYVDGGGCTSCRLHLHKYNDALKALSDSAGTEVGFLCIVCPKNFDELKRILKIENRGNLPVLVDMSDSLNRLNDFPEADGLADVSCRPRQPCARSGRSGGKSSDNAAVYIHPHQRFCEAATAAYAENISSDVSFENGYRACSHGRFRSGRISSGQLR